MLTEQHLYILLVNMPKKNKLDDKLLFSGKNVFSRKFGKPSR